MNDLAIIRSMTSKEGSHPRATYLVAPRLPADGRRASFPTLGSQRGPADRRRGRRAAQLRADRRPACRTPGAAASWASTTIRSCCRTADAAGEHPAANVASSVTPAGSSLLDESEADFAAEAGPAIVADQRKLIERPREMILSPRMEAFDLSREPSQMRDAYGQGEFGAGCLLARRLVEPGVTFVEVVSNGWDTHDDNFDRTAATGRPDRSADGAAGGRPQAARHAGKTLVIWMGEFGRTPRINARAGRDHYPRAFNVVLAGGGVRGGQVVGRIRRRRRGSDRPPRDGQRPVPHDLPHARHRRRPRKHEPHRPADQARRRRRSGARATKLSQLVSKVDLSLQKRNVCHWVAGKPVVTGFFEVLDKPRTMWETARRGRCVACMPQRGYCGYRLLNPS